MNVVTILTAWPAVIKVLQTRSLSSTSSGSIAATHVKQMPGARRSYCLVSISAGCRQTHKAADESPVWLIGVEGVRQAFNDTEHRAFCYLFPANASNMGRRLVSSRGGVGCGA